MHFRTRTESPGAPLIHRMREGLRYHRRGRHTGRWREERRPPQLSFDRPPPPAWTMPLADEDDASLVARCRNGEEPAWEILVRRYQRLVYAIVRRSGLDEHAAADVFQTVFSRLVVHLPRLADPGRLQAWIVTTAKREMLLALKRGRRTVSMTRHDDDSEEDGAAGVLDIADDALLPEQVLDDLQQLDGLRRALDRLDPRCRELLTLLFRADDDKVSYDEIGRRMNMSIGSIGPTRSRCLSRLRTLVEGA